jgi:hypothetical protein
MCLQATYFAICWFVLLLWKRLPRVPSFALWLWHILQWHIWYVNMRGRGTKLGNVNFVPQKAGEQCEWNWDRCFKEEEGGFANPNIRHMADWLMEAAIGLCARRQVILINVPRLYYVCPYADGIIRVVLIPVHPYHLLRSFCLMHVFVFLPTGGELDCANGLIGGEEGRKECLGWWWWMSWMVSHSGN